MILDAQQPLVQDTQPYLADLVFLTSLKLLAVDKLCGYIRQHSSSPVQFRFLLFNPPLSVQRCESLVYPNLS
jgi:hypothetical protein